jgi:hypothetical protein
MTALHGDIWMIAGGNEYYRRRGVRVVRRETNPQLEREPRIVLYRNVIRLCQLDLDASNIRSLRDLRLWPSSQTGRLLRSGMPTTYEEI